MDASETALKYPFSSQARELLAKQGSMPLAKEEMSRARSRIVAAVEGKPYLQESDAATEAGIFALCRLLLGIAGNGDALYKFGKAEAARAREKLENDDAEDFLKMAKQVFPSIETNSDAGSNTNYTVSVLDYLEKGGAGLESEKVEAGKLHFDRKGLSSALEKAIAKRISEVKVDAKTVPKVVKDEAQALRDILEDKAKVLVPRYKTKLLSTPALQKLVNGVGEGKRYYASMAISIACVNDGLTKEQASGILKAFAKNCTGAQPFTEHEALASVDWVYKHPTIKFSCRTVADQGLMDYSECLQSVGFGRGSAKGKGKFGGALAKTQN